MAVATWRWVANDDNCGICRMPFENCCTECTLPGDDCPLVWGACSHCFHMHCIVKWLNSQHLNQQCPIMSLPGLPPLPKSLSTLETAGAHTNNSSNFGSIESQRGVSPINRKTSTLDTQLAILRREMFGLRQLDLSLLSQLWALNESIQEFRAIIQEQEALSPPSPSPSPSDTNSLSSGDEGDSSTQDRNHPSAIQMQQKQQQQ
ncbi:Anaphase-promoting complex subunit 11, partial [Pseudolycoriella hygida]